MGFSLAFALLAVWRAVGEFPLSSGLGRLCGYDLHDHQRAFLFHGARSRHGRRSEPNLRMAAKDLRFYGSGVAGNRPAVASLQGCLCLPGGPRDAARHFGPQRRLVGFRAVGCGRMAQHDFCPLFRGRSDSFGPSHGDYIADPVKADLSPGCLHHSAAPGESG